MLDFFTPSRVSFWYDGEIKFQQRAEIGANAFRSPISLPTPSIKHHEFHVQSPTTWACNRRPLLVAQALEMQPTSSTFRMLCAAIAYGMTSGGYNAEAITLTQLGRRMSPLPTKVTTR